MAATRARKWHRTLKRSIEFSGVGLHSGKYVRIRVAPPTTSAAPAALQNDAAITFRQRGRTPIRVGVDALDPAMSMLCTQLRAHDDSWRVSTVEHLMAALVAARVTHADVDIVDCGQADGVVELPILDGSALPFVEAVHQAGVRELTDGLPAKYLCVQRPVQVLMEDKAAWFLPIPQGIPGMASPTLHVSVHVNFAHKGLGNRFFQFSLTEDADANLQAFKKDVAPARTFTFEDEIAWMQAHNLALGGSLENAVVFSARQERIAQATVRVLNPEGLRFAEDEWVRHKLLDCVGDLGLVGLPIHGYFFATSPGHALTHRLITELFTNPTNYSVTS